MERRVLSIKICVLASRFHRPADHITAKEIDNHRQIQPALPGADISNIGDPDLVGPDNGELPLHAIRSND